jgi:hypothetical protein
MNNGDKNAGIMVAAGGLKVHASTNTLATGHGITRYSWVQTRASHGLRGNGKFYYEGQQIMTGDGLSLCRFGWSIVGAMELGHDAYGFGYGATGI